MFLPWEELISIVFHRSMRRKLSWVELDLRCPRLLPSTFSRLHVTFIVHFGQDERGSLLGHCGRACNLGRNKLPKFTFLKGNGAKMEHHGVWKTLWYCSILVHKHKKMFSRRQTDKIYYPAKYLGSDLCLILMISSLTTPSLKLK